MCMVSYAADDAVWEQPVHVRAQVPAASINYRLLLLQHLDHTLANQHYLIIAHCKATRLHILSCAHNDPGICHQGGAHQAI